MVNTCTIQKKERKCLLLFIVIKHKKQDKNNQNLNAKKCIKTRIDQRLLVQYLNDLIILDKTKLLSIQLCTNVTLK